MLSKAINFPRSLQKATTMPFLALCKERNMSNAQNKDLRQCEAVSFMFVVGASAIIGIWLMVKWPRGACHFTIMLHRKYSESKNILAQVQLRRSPGLKRGQAGAVRQLSMNLSSGSSGLPESVVWNLPLNCAMILKTFMQ
jgi:hypothetical protein